MVNIHPEYILDKEKNCKAVQLPLAEWNQLISELEELDDIRAYDAVKNQTSEKIPFEQAVREIQQDYEV